MAELLLLFFFFFFFFGIWINGDLWCMSEVQGWQTAEKGGRLEVSHYRLNPDTIDRT